MSSNLASILMRRIRSLRGVLGGVGMVAPEHIVRSIPERSLDSLVASHIADMRVIRPAGVESYPLHTGLPPAFRTEMHFARRHVYRLGDVRVNPLTGGCRADDCLFQESYGSMRRCLLENPFPPPGGPVQKVRALATCVHATGYYHFLLEEVPRLLWVMGQYPEAKIILADKAPRFAMQILDLLVFGKTIRGYEMVNSRQTLQCDGYVFTQAEAYSGFVHSTDLAILLEHICANPAEGPGASRKIYVSRKNASRPFDNEADVEAMLGNQGFEIVCGERLTFAEQVALFRSAGTVVAGHGAGLANLVWCRAGTRVVEMFSPKHFNDCYARLSSTMRLDYQPLWAAASHGWGEVDLAGLEKAILHA